MQRDFKVGMLLGLILAMAGILWLSTRPSLTPPPSAEFLNSKSEILNSPAGSPANFSDVGPAPDASRVVRGASFVQDTQYAIRNTQHATRPENITTQRFHIVREDETLSAISQQYYGSANNWQKIFQANRSRLKDPNRITPGTKLIIPD
jgi:LysM repeat protein